jgi:hypothetical protein
LALAAGVLVLALTSTSTAQAQTAPPGAGGPPVASDPSAGSAPNRVVIATGLLTWGIAYVPALVVGSESNVYSDARLFVPVLGPWLDVADRPLCGPGSVSCRIEPWNELAIVVDGVFQAWGIGAAIAGIFVKEHPPTSSTPSSSALRFAPTRMGASGAGFAAFGSF